MSRTKGSGRGYDPGQLQIEWRSQGANTVNPPTPENPGGTLLAQWLKWDFVTSFPQPTPDAIDTGILNKVDMAPIGIRRIHDGYARELLRILTDLDAVLDERRKDIYAATRRSPPPPAATERLQKRFITEPERLVRRFLSMMDGYRGAFGSEAADEFARAIHARHSGIPVMAEHPSDLSVNAAQKPSRRQIREHTQRTAPRRIIARMPSPKPLPASVAAGHFGKDDEGQPIRPGANEVREITERHAEKLIEMLDALASAPSADKDRIRLEFESGLHAYAEDFGQPAADQLESYVCRQAGLDRCDRRDR